MAMIAATALRPTVTKIVRLLYNIDPEVNNSTTLIL
ncbi:hypothetical protein BDK88_4133 [Natrinema hispanicum]|uniref:Uncharacterized protein n=1 Tax=Natrinema hispanicum TaxID=392421 RepID=A0A482Y6G4_9EURY|nr:hypothetical protein BDK88_4133 [Natrinema hispanicum]